MYESDIGPSKNLIYPFQNLEGTLFVLDSISDSILVSYFLIKTNIYLYIYILFVTKKSNMLIKDYTSKF